MKGNKPGLMLRYECRVHAEGYRFYDPVKGNESETVMIPNFGLKEWPPKTIAKQLSPDAFLEYANCGIGWGGITHEERKQRMLDFTLNYGDMLGSEDYGSTDRPEDVPDRFSRVFDFFLGANDMKARIEKIMDRDIDDEIQNLTDPEYTNTLRHGFEKDEVTGRLQHIVTADYLYQAIEFQVTENLFFVDHIKVCTVCGKLFKSKRSDKETCSNNCRQKKHQEEKK